MDIVVMTLLLLGLVASAAVCVFIRNLLKASIALAAVSGVLAVIMFLMGAPLAAAFELSVCAGLITVIFVSAVSMTRLVSKEEGAERDRRHHRRFSPLPVLLIVLVAGALVVLLPRLGELMPFEFAPTRHTAEPDFFWNTRQADLLGQIVIVLAGVYGVLIFFKEREDK